MTPILPPESDERPVVRRPAPTAAEADELMRIARNVTNAYLRTRPRARRDFDHLLSDATLGCVKAWRRYDPERGASLSTYAYLRARNEVLDGIRVRGNLTREECTAGLVDEDVPAARRVPVSIESLAEFTGMPLVVVDPTAQRDYERAEASIVLPGLLRVLPDRERQVIVDIYLRERTAVQVAKDLGVTESRVSQLRKAALAQMRQSTDLIAADAA